jgi:hypothetical protein
MSDRSTAERIRIGRSALSAARIAAWWIALGAEALAGAPGVGIVVDAISDEFEVPWSF